MNQLYEAGNAIRVGSNILECTAVSYQEVDGQKLKFSYTFRLQSELEADRAAQVKLDAEIEAARVEQEKAAAKVPAKE